MNDFYRIYKKEKGKISKAEALRQAQVRMLKGKNGENYSRPVYWGAFIILGNL